MAGWLRQSLRHLQLQAGSSLLLVAGALEGKAECCASISPALLPGSYSLFSNPGTLEIVYTHPLPSSPCPPFVTHPPTLPCLTKSHPSFKIQPWVSLCEAIPFAPGWDILLPNQPLGERLSFQPHYPSARRSSWHIGCLAGVRWMKHGKDGGVKGTV